MIVNYLFGLCTQFFQSSLLPAEKAIALHITDNKLQVRSQHTTNYETTKHRKVNL